MSDGAHPENFTPPQDALVAHDEMLVITPDRKPQIEMFAGWASDWSQRDEPARALTDSHKKTILDQLDAIDDPHDREQFTPVYEAFKQKYVVENKTDSEPAQLRSFLTRVALKIGDEKTLKDLSVLYSKELTDIRKDFKPDERKHIMEEMDSILGGTDSESVKSDLFSALRRFIGHDSSPSSTDPNSKKYMGIFYEQHDAAKILAKRIKQHDYEGELTIDTLKNKMVSMSKRGDLAFESFCEFFSWRIKEIGIQNPALRLKAAQSLIEFLNQGGENIGRPISDYQLYRVIDGSLIPQVKEMDTQMKATLINPAPGANLSLLDSLFASPSCLQSYGSSLVNMMYQMAATEKDVTAWDQNEVVDGIYARFDHATRYKPADGQVRGPQFQDRKDNSAFYLNLLKNKFPFLQTPPESRVSSTFVQGIPTS